MTPPTFDASVHPAPTPDEAAAIMAAVEALWPKPALETMPPSREKTLAWRFSGRWWHRDRFARAERPWT